MRKVALTTRMQEVSEEVSEEYTEDTELCCLLIHYHYYF